MTMKTSRRFSLVELLVVIAVMAMLTSLLMPALQQAKGTAKRITCLGNLKQLGLGVGSYIDDNGDCMPLAWWDNLYHFRGLMVSGGAPQFSSGYTPLHLWDCPADTTREHNVDFWNYWTGASPPANISYGYNQKVGSFGGAEVRLPPRMNYFGKLSENVLICELTRDTMLSSINYFLLFPTWGADFERGPRFVINQPNHGKGCNFLFMDGHAMFYTALDYMNALRRQGDFVKGYSGDAYRVNY